METMAQGKSREVSSEPASPDGASSRRWAPYDSYEEIEPVLVEMYRERHDGYFPAGWDVRIR